MSFEVEVEKRLGDRLIRASFATGPGLVGLVGPSGAGKTSILNMIAGLMKPDRGRIAVAGQILFGGGVDLPPEQRRAGYVFQDGRLFPHRRVRANLDYGLRCRGEDVGGPVLDEMAEFLGIGTLLDRWPRTLSGGEAQRVAIGRALLSSPRFLLLDEPLTSLDQQRREETLRVIERIRDTMAMPILYVSHDRAEVGRLANEVVTIDY